jgi:hypothetical protein
MKLSVRKVAWLGTVGLVAAALAIFAPIGAGDNYGGNEGGYTTVCRTVDNTGSFPTFHYESCAGTAKLGRFNVYYAGGPGCSRWAFKATYWWPDTHADKWHANYCVDGTDHWTPVFALHIAQLTLDGTGGLNGQQGIPPTHTVIDWGLYR